MIKCYVARAMSGRKASDVVREAKLDRMFLEEAGFTVLCPVSEEGVKASAKPIRASKELMDTYWKRDKALIRQAHVVFNMSPDQASLGVIREHGYARYECWKPVISVFPAGKFPHMGAVCHYEDDYVTDDLWDAADIALIKYGTRWKRLKWRIALYNRCWIGHCLRKLSFWFQ